MYKFVCSKSVFNTLYNEIKKANVKTFPSDKINGTKNAQPHHSSTFNLRLLHELKHNVRLSKSVCGIFHCQFCLVFIKVYIFVQRNAWAFWLLNVLILFKIKIIENPYTVLLLNLSFLKVLQEVSKFNDVCVSWIFPKTDLEINF